MKNISSNARNTLILVSVLILALLFAVYYYVVLPKTNEVEATQTAITDLKNEIVSINDQILIIEDEQNQALANLFTLRQKVPATRDIESFIRDIEEVEAITGSRIENISFNNYDAQVSGAGLVDPNAPAPVEGQATEGQATTPTATEAQPATESQPAVEGQQTTEGQQAQEETLPVATIDPATLPGELQMITLSVSVLSPNFETLQEFIKEFERMDRVVKVDTFNFALPGEEDFISADPNYEVSAEIQITTFYYVGEQ